MLEKMGHSHLLATRVKVRRRVRDDGTRLWGVEMLLRKHNTKFKISKTMANQIKARCKKIDSIHQ